MSHLSIPFPKYDQGQYSLFHPALRASRLHTNADGTPSSRMAASEILTDDH